MTILAKNLKRLVREHDIPSYKALAKKTGVSDKTLKKIMEGPDHCASLKTRLKIAEAFGEDPIKMSKEEPVDVLSLPVDGCAPMLLGSSEGLPGQWKYFSKMELYLKYIFYALCIATFFIIAIFTFFVWLLYV